MRQLILLLFLFSSATTLGQDFGDFPKIEQKKLELDLELLYQGLDKYHTGMYWYTAKEHVNAAFERARNTLDRDLNALEFHKIIAPLVALSREDHTDIYLPDPIMEKVIDEALFFPLSVVFLNERLYCVKNGSNLDEEIAGEITSINNESPKEIVDKIGSLFASDGYIKAVKYSDLEGFSFALYMYYHYGLQSSFTIKFGDRTETVRALPLKEIRENISKRTKETIADIEVKESLEFKLIDDQIAYLGLHSFSNSTITENKINNDLKSFLASSFKKIEEKGIRKLIIDLSENGGGTEGNEGLVYSYLGDNYKKYKYVKAKAQKVELDNGVDEPIRFKTFGLSERFFGNKRGDDGSILRRKNAKYGLMAYKKEPVHKYQGDIFVMISPVTYSGGSELANMIYTNELAVFVGEETGGGYYGNTSGYSQELTLPHSQITIDIPALQFAMNVQETIPFGRGVIPHHQVTPTFSQYINGEDVVLNFILEQLIYPNQ